MKYTSILNDDATLPSCALKDENQRAWIERYKSAPSISPPGLPASGGQGFIDGSASSDQFTLTDQLNARGREAERAMGPDKERLQLFYAAEMAHNCASKAEARQALGELIEYDRAHGHPVADPSRDLVSAPYTAQEQSSWHRRDGRDLTSREQEEAQALGWRNHHAQREAMKPAALGEWWVHPSVEPRQRREVSEQRARQQLTQDLEEGRSVSVTPVGAAAIRARRGQSL